MSTSDEELLNAIRTLARSAVDDATLGRVVRSMVGQGALPAPVPQRDIVPLKVRLQGGQVTNISLPKALLESVGAAIGGLDAARKKARELAIAAPQTNNRSGWVQDQLALLVRPEAARSAQTANS